ncbi:MAG: hypothetical protein H0V31_02050 [Acidobacteria bacterium]|nr:hypothetical protein [Acidobacteriota bacterium]
MARCETARPSNSDFSWQFRFAADYCQNAAREKAVEYTKTPKPTEIADLR